MFVVTRRFEFDAAHRLLGYDGKCNRVHGHRYVVDVSLKGEGLNDLGMLIDFGNIKAIVKPWIERWDHHTILHPRDPLRSLLPTGHDVPMPDTGDERSFNPTAENMAKALYETVRVGLPDNVVMDSVTVWETPTCWAEYRE